MDIKMHQIRIYSKFVVFPLSYSSGIHYQPNIWSPPKRGSMEMQGMQMQQTPAQPVASKAQTIFHTTPSERCKIVVGNLPSGTTHEDLESLGRRFGPVMQALAFDTGKLFFPIINLSIMDFVH
jgi:hypothetical protein